MSVRVELVAWEPNRRPADLISGTKPRDADYVLVATHSDASALDSVVHLVESIPAADIIIVHDPVNRSPWRRLRSAVPSHLFLMTALPDHDAAIAVSIQAMTSHTDIVNRSGSLGEMVVRLAEHGAVSFVETDNNSPGPPIPVPQLTTPSHSPSSLWLREIIQQTVVSGTMPSPTNLAALKAGLFLLNDFFDESHSCSQSIEGLGAYHTGDYWHAILHRREPDYGNSKYWFRHVGRHPVFAELARRTSARLDAVAGSLSGHLERWKRRLVSDGQWDPLAFVDLCEAAENDPELRGWCEHVQHDEMLLLLESTFRETVRS